MTMADLVLQSTGNMVAAAQWCSDNDVCLSEVPVPGTLYTVSDTALTIAGAKGLAVRQELSRGQIVIGTLNEIPPVPDPPPALALEVLLYPKMFGARLGTTTPSVAGYWQFEMTPHADFIHANDLTAYVGDLHCQCEGEETYLASGGAGSSLTPYSTAALPTVDIIYRPVYSIPDYSMSWWEPIDGIRFEDSDGNRANIYPIVLMAKVSNTLVWYLCPELAVEFVSTDGYTCTVRVTKSHVTPSGTPGSDFATYSTHFTDYVTGAYADPADPLNGNKIMLDLPAGKYTLGVQAVYYNAGADRYFPATGIQCVIEIL